MPKVSVIVPVYNVERYIERCVRSLFEQSIDDIEYIFIDDCGKDNSISIIQNTLEEYPLRKKQVKIVNMPYNSGQAAARKMGISHAQGDYIIHCDSDDYVDINMYYDMYNCAKMFHSDIVFCNMYITNGKKHKLQKQKWNSFKGDVLNTMLRNVQWSLCTALVNKKIVTNNNIVYPSKNNGEDCALMSQYVLCSKTFSHIDKGYYYYYSNSNSITKVLGYENYVTRLNDFISNANIVIGTLLSKDPVRYNNIIILLKLYCRSKISEITHIKKYKDIWSSTFQEIRDISVLFNMSIPIRTKLNYFAVKTNMYSFYRKIIAIVPRLKR